MGAYLDKPEKEKESEYGSNTRLAYAATSMQGWRVNQEDAHNCILDFDDGVSYFAVYDGHGGPEVSQYTSDNFPDFLRGSATWKTKDVRAALETAFLEFDDTLRSEAVMKKLREIADAKSGDKKESSEDDEEDIRDRLETIEEGRMPLEKILAKYGYQILRKPLGNPAAGGAVKKIGPVEGEPRDENKSENEATDSDADNDKADGERPQRKKRQPMRSPTDEPKKKQKTDETPKNSSDGEPANASDDSSDDVDFDAAHAEAAESDSNEDEDEEDADEEEEGEDDDDEEEEEEEEEEESGPTPFQMMSVGDNGDEVPGDDSGTTACVVVLTSTDVIVANAGDSRAVLCRNGDAVDLSEDHKPEDPIERERIERAGGCITDEGRVNGGLNLSRALGDHCYKKNSSLPLADQMISSKPDIKLLTRTDEDEFLVVACDGIWNSMTSQNVVDFVRERLTKGVSLKAIAEQLCDNCLADSTAGDGTGCDNMTVVVVSLRPATVRTHDPEDEVAEKGKENNGEKKDGNSDKIEL